MENISNTKTDQMIKEDERIDDLQRNHYRIIQKKNGFCFGMDAVLLSGFVQIKQGEQIRALKREEEQNA